MKFIQLAIISVFAVITLLAHAQYKELFKPETIDIQFKNSRDLTNWFRSQGTGHVYSHRVNQSGMGAYLYQPPEWKLADEAAAYKTGEGRVICFVFSSVIKYNGFEEQYSEAYRIYCKNSQCSVNAKDITFSTYSNVKCGSDPLNIKIFDANYKRP